MRRYVADEDPIHFDIDRIRRDPAAKTHGQDVVFQVRIVAVSPDGTSVSAYLIPWTEMENSVTIARSELAKFAVAPPAESDLCGIAHDLQIGQGEA